MLYKALFSTILWCLYFIDIIYASHYMTKPLNSVQLLEEDSERIDARSPTECILKCQNRFQKNGFYTNDNSCFCTNGTTSDTVWTGASGLNGNLYLKREIESK